MIIPKWLLPVIASIAALAIGAAAAVIGFNFSPHTTQTQAAPTVTIPVLNPVSIGSEPLLGEDGLPEISTSTSETTVSVAGSVDLDHIDPAVIASLEELQSMDDPAASEQALTGGSAPSDPDPAADDACSADPIPPGCPDGVPAIVIGDEHSIGDFRVYAETYPGLPVAGRWAGCPAPAVRNDTDLPMTIVAMAPASIEFDYWPISDPTDVTHHPVSTSTDDRDAYDRALLGYSGPDGEFFFPINHCFVLEGLDYGVTYQYRVRGTDDLDRTDDFTGTLALRDLRDRPPTRVTGEHDRYLNVWAAMKPDEDARVSVFAVPDGIDATCAAAFAAGLTPQPAIQPIRYGFTDPDYLERYNYGADYTENVSGNYTVPTGSRIVVCVRWYADGEGPEHAATPLYQSQYVTTSPAVMYPTLNLIGYQGHSAIPVSAIEFVTSLPDGLICNTGSFPDQSLFDLHEGEFTLAGDHFSMPLCTLDDRLLAGHRSYSIHVVATARRIPFESEPRIRQLAEFGLVGFDSRRCGDVCEAPDWPAFTVDLGVGTAVFNYTWSLPEGTPPGVTGRWGEGSFTEGDYDEPLPDQIQLAQDEELTLTQPGPGFGYRLEYHVVADRPVTWTARLDGSDCHLGSNPATDRSAALAASSDLVIDGLCPGEQYLLVITLTAEDGTTTVWQHLYGPDRRFWPQSIATPPGVEGTLILTTEITDAPRDYLRSTLSFDLGLGGTYSYGGDRSDCTTYHLQSTHPIEPTVIASYDMNLDVRVRAIACNDGRLMEFEVPVGPITLAELMRGVEIIPDPSSGWTARLFLAFRPA